MKSDKEIIARQYNEWIYPPPITDMAEWVARGNVEFSDPSLFGLHYWPRRRDFTGLNILVSGCGTNQAANIAYKNPLCRVTGVDVSENSLAHEKFLLEKHSLHNLRLALTDLDRVDRLDEQYDLIICTGVLHHLPDPDAGLRSLAGVLRPDGAMCLMIYGKSLRAGIYQLQEAFQMLGLGQSKKDIELVKYALAHVPEHHAVNAYLKRSPWDLDHDSGIVDTFLNRVDRAYSIPEVFDFIARNGLKFMRWQDPADYSLLNVIRPDNPLHSLAAALPQERQWHLGDLLTQTKGTHTFIACNSSRAESDYRTRFDNEEFVEYIPCVTPGLFVLEPANPTTRRGARIRRKQHQLDLEYLHGLLLRQVDGHHSIGDILEQLYYFSCPREEAIDIARNMFRMMSDLGHLMFRLPA